jgi:drug/metabolite transporter (DMT)-like permease
MHRIDLLLALMVLIWGANFSVIKRCFEEIPPQPFNALRLILSSAVFLAAIRAAAARARDAGDRRSTVFSTPHPLTAADRRTLVWLGLIGHCAYQFCFVGGVALTNVSNAALIIGSTPVVVATASAALGHDRIAPVHWAGALISVAGIVIVVGHGASFGGATFLGDLLVMGSVACWATYTIGASGLMARHSPLYVTGMSMAIGAVPYVALAVPAMLRVDWAAVSAWTWTATALSALLALNAAYLIWYIGVKAIGPARTSIYSNVVPSVAIAVAAVWLGEPLTPVKLAGAAAVLGGVFLTRLASRAAPAAPRAPS